MALVNIEDIKRTPIVSTPKTSLPSYEGGEDKNVGGLVGGVGYLGEKVAVGAVQSIEGISDYVVGGIAKLFGFDKFAERQFVNDWFGDWYDHPDEWFKPSGAWKVAGDIAGGIGTSLPTLAVGLATAGAGTALAGASMFATAGLGAAGNATKEAVRETGKLTGEELAYGGLTGALEGGLETVTNLIGFGTGAVIKSVGKQFGKEFTKKAVRDGIAITLAKSFGGEAFEEAMAEIFNAPIKRATYDPNAEGTTAGQVLYASFVGGMSGVVMGGAGTVFSNARNTARGKSAVEAGETDSILKAAKYLSEKNSNNNVDVGALEQVKVTYAKLSKSLEKTNGVVETAAQRRMLGELKLDNVAAVVQPKVYRTASNIINDPDAVVKRINTIGYTDSNGNKVTVTKEMLLEGVDINDIKGTLHKALQSNEILRDVTFMSLAGEMMLNTSQFQEAVLRGEKFAGDADLENFLKVATSEERQEIEKLTNIPDLSKVDADTFNEKVAELYASGIVDEAQALYQTKKTDSADAIIPENNSISTENSASLNEIGANIAENGLEITEKTEAITDKGEITPDNSNNSVQNKEDSSRKTLPGTETESTTESGKGEQMTVEDSIRYANENIPEMKDLNAEEKSRVRRLVRQMKSKGFTDKQIRSYARVSARSGIDIVVDKESLRYENKKGETRYADGMYSPKRNKILVNPEGSRSLSRVLIHELTHAIYKTSEGKLLLEEGARNLSEEEKNRIVAKYFADDLVMTKEKVLEYADELNAHYIEALLDDERLLEKLVESNPTLPKKILSFFKKAITGYSDEPALSKEAKKLYKRYKTLFDSFSERNQYGSPEEARMSGGDRMALPDTTYLDAVNRGDIETAQRMVDEAAKEAGYSTEHLYHGTSMFGFTDIDVSSASDDSISFFATNRQEVASGYMPWYEDDASDRYHDNVRRIGVPDNSRPRGLSRSYDAERILSEARKVFPEYKDARVATDGEILADLKTYWLGETIEAAEKLRKIELSIGSNKFRQQIRDMCDAIIAASKEDTLEAWRTVGNRYKEFESVDIPYDATDMRPQIFHSRILGGLQQVGKFSKTTAIVLDGQLTSTSAIVDRYNSFLGGETLGMYDLYTKQSNQLVVQGRGSSWNQIPLGKLESEYMEWLGEKVSEEFSGKRVTTRDLAAFAKAKGYRSVVFYDIYDNGAYGSAADISDVYAFFYPNEDVKSADPVTYDAKGNVIPLSQRFKSENDDIRYALSDEDVNPLDMSESVAKKRKAYDESLKQKLITAKDSIYIDTVDELYGVEKYLRVFGNKNKDAASMVQAVRASMSAAQTMLGDVQKDIFSEKGKKLGDGLSRIIKPLYSRGENVQIAFNEYLMHHLNVDRMSLEKKSLARLEEMKTKLKGDIEKLRKVNAKISELKAKKKSLFSDEVAQVKLDESLEKYEKAAMALKKDILEQKKQIDNFEVMKNKPIFGENDNRAEAITAEQSLKRISEIEKVHPDFKEVAEKIWAYTKNLNHMRVEAGLISAESEAYMNELYPHYVPAYRDTTGGGIAAIRGKRNLAISSTVKTAKGGGLDVLDVVDSIAAQTQEMIRAGRINQLFREVYEAAKSGKGVDYVEIVTREKVSGEQVAENSTSEELTSAIEVRPKGNQITGFVDGTKVTIKVSDELFIAFDSMGKPTVDPTSAMGRGAKKLNDIYKKLITSWSPAFLLRNPIRDIQDAGLNSKHARLFWKNLPKVYKMMYDNSELWQEYRAYGGFSASIFGEDGFSADVDKRGFEAMSKLFDTDAPTLNDMWKAAKRGGKNIFIGISNLNAFIEQATRFAEYVASREAGDSISVSINNAAEVTTNFGRRGRLTKKLNATIMPFLNPAIQGFDKIFRNIGDAAKAGSPKAIAKAYASLLSKAAIIGLAPMIVNMLMYGDDEDYEKLREEDKENNFLIKVGDTFIKIPRGRVASVIGGTANRGYKLAKGEDADLQGYFENAMEQVTPVGNMTRTILSPFFDVRNNRTWYGTEIESRQWDNTSPKDRYDESTSSIAKAISDALHTVGIGKAMEISPKKVHYLLDQYSGVIGDFLLPATSKKAHRGFFGGNFTIDPATSNKLSKQFYDIYDKAQYAKTSGDDTAIYQVKYLNGVKNAISEMHNEKQSIQADTTLTNSEKLQKTRVVQILINQVYETAIADIEQYTKAFEATKGIESTEMFKSAFGEGASDATIQKKRYTEATRYMYGAKKALEDYDDSVFAKCELLNLAGIDYDNLYYYYFATKGITSDTDKAGNTISGSKRKKVIAEVNKLKISTEQKLLLIAAKGYALSEKDKRRLLIYILKLKTSRENREELAKMCGFKVKNGRIVVK